MLCEAVYRAPTPNSRFNSASPVRVTVTAREPSRRRIQPASKAWLAMVAPSTPAMWGRRSLQSRQGRQSGRVPFSLVAGSLRPISRKASDPSGDSSPPSSLKITIFRAIRASLIATPNCPARWS